MKFITSPEEVSGAKVSGSPVMLFLAGGISGCPDWQQEALERLQDSELLVFNPRREVWVMDGEVATEQIGWEHRHLLKADVILFWFPCETLCPITLFELGAWLHRPKKLFVGCHPRYQRRLDVTQQAYRERPKLNVYDSLAEMCSHVGGWAASRILDRSDCPACDRVITDTERINWLGRYNSRVQDAYYHRENEPHNLREAIDYLMKLPAEEEK